jgi:K+-sensing histidine kinase KdpD
MKLKNVRKWSQHGPECYLYSILGVVFAFYIRYLLHPFLQSEFPMLFFIANIIVIGMFFGYAASAFSALLSFPIAFYFFVPPFDSFDMPTLHDTFIFGTSVVLCGVVVGFIEWLQRARYRAELIANVSNSRYALLAEASYTLKLKKLTEDPLDPKS